MACLGVGIGKRLRERSRATFRDIPPALREAALAPGLSEMGIAPVARGEGFIAPALRPTKIDRLLSARLDRIAARSLNEPLSPSNREAAYKVESGWPRGTSFQADAKRHLAMGKRAVYEVAHNDC